jgi:hypothetical protein
VSASERVKPDLPDGFEALAEAQQRRRQRSRLLQRGNGADQHLGIKLANCRKGRRCGSEADPICIGKFRLWLYRQALPIFASRPHWTRASIVTAGVLIRYGQLHSFNLHAFVKRIAKRLERSSLRNRIMFCGVDVSLNLRNNVIIGWQFHLYVLIEGRSTTALHEALKAAFPPEPTAKAPYKFRLAADPESAITYLYKSMFCRRSEYTAPNGKRRTKIQPLKGPELRELLVFLDRYPIGTRLILRGLRRDGKHLIPTRTKQ